MRNLHQYFRSEPARLIYRMSVAGTVPYLAPEVIRDRKCSKAMDVWSFGLVLWEVLTGATPFEGLQLGAVQLKVSCNSVSST